LETDPQILLALLALQMQGGRQVPATAAVLKSLKSQLQLAKAQSLIAERKVKLPVISPKTGKVASQDTIVFDLTPQGENRLRELGDASIQAAAAAAQREALKQTLEQDRRALRDEVLAALTGPTKAKGKDPSKEIAALGKALEKIQESIRKMEAAIQGNDSSAILTRIDLAFEAFLKKLDSAAPPDSGHRGPAAAAAVDKPTLQNVLHAAYRKLRQFVEFEDGLVPIPRLYHETRRTMPALSVEAFHRELQALWDRRELELKILNNVRDASEPDKAITRGENLYYYVFWARP
jgi:hypothetical protein